LSLKIAAGNWQSHLREEECPKKVLEIDIPQVSGWHRRLFDSNDGPSFVQEPHIVLLFKNLNRDMEKFFMIAMMQKAKYCFGNVHESMAITTP